MWWRCADGKFTKDERSTFAIATAVRAGYIVDQAAELPAPPSLAEALTARWFRESYSGPTLVVMPKAKSTKLNNYNKVFNEILDKPLPLVCARNLDEARRDIAGSDHCLRICIGHG